MKIAKYILILILFAFFLTAFAKPSYRKFWRGDILTVESVGYPGEPKSPAITICLKEVSRLQGHSQHPSESRSLLLLK